MNSKLFMLKLRDLKDMLINPEDKDKVQSVIKIVEVLETNTKKLYDLYDKSEYLEFRLNWVNDNEDTYDAKIEGELIDEHSKVTEEIKKLESILPKKLISFVSDKWILENYGE